MLSSTHRNRKLSLEYNLFVAYVMDGIGNLIFESVQEHKWVKNWL
jgi:hypothetical protein